MNLGLFLAIGESLSDFEKRGQLARLVNYNINKYAQIFDEVFIFTYQNEQFKLPKNCILVTNKWGIHRYIYALLLPIIHIRYVKKCDILRGLQLTGGIPAAVAKVLFGKKFIINYGYDYASFAKIEGKHIQPILYKMIQKPILSLADAIIVTSQDLAKQLGNIGGSKIFYIPNGVDLGLFRPIKDKSFGKILKIIYVGRFEKQKNLESIIKAVSQVKSQIVLDFYGFGKEQKPLRQLADSLAVRLSIHDPVDYLVLPKILASAHVFVLPSLEEGSPKILFEAMACGLPIIGTNVRGIKELIINGKTGLLVEPNPASIAQAIQKLAKNPKLREKLSLAARQFVQARFDINKLLDQEINLLNKIS